MKITTAQIENWILATGEKNNLTGLPIVGLVLSTIPKMTVKSRATGEPSIYPQGVEKLARRVYMLAKMGSYENKVNNTLEKMGADRDFDAKELWKGKGERAGTLMARHTETGKLYLTGFPQQNREGVIVSGETEYRDIATGRTLDDAEVKNLKDNFFPKSDFSSPVPYNTIALTGIRSIKYCGETVEVIPDKVEQLA